MAAGASRTAGWLVAVAALLTLGAGLLGWRLAGRTAVAEAPRSRPPEIRLEALAGGTIGFGDYTGRVVVVDFWASWCGPCRLQAKILGTLYEELGNDVQFLAVNLGEDRETVERYVADHAFPYPVLMDPREQLGYDLEIYALPTVMVLDRDGQIAYLRAGISDRGALASALSAAGVDGIDDRPA